ncbi:UNVERIFIED_ORG: hypothetical protein LHJ69_05340 [Shinella sp. XGS7]|nr:hypothetical protein [Shinella sp. XGS7]
MDLVDQLTAYRHRKLAEQPGTILVTLLPKVRRGVDNKGWDLAVEELTGFMNQVAARMNASG